VLVFSLAVRGLKCSLHRYYLFIIILLFVESGGKGRFYFRQKQIFFREKSGFAGNFPVEGCISTGHGFTENFGKKKQEGQTERVVPPEVSYARFRTYGFTAG
jgi:hypothetical protein